MQTHFLAHGQIWQSAVKKKLIAGFWATSRYRAKWDLFNQRNNNETPIKMLICDVMIFFGSNDKWRADRWCMIIERDRAHCQFWGGADQQTQVKSKGIVSQSDCSLTVHVVTAGPAIWNYGNLGCQFIWGGRSFIYNALHSFFPKSVEVIATQQCTEWALAT